MATVEQIRALTNCCGDRKAEFVASTAAPLAADMARGKKGLLAQQLRVLRGRFRNECDA